MLNRLKNYINTIPKENDLSLNDIFKPINSVVTFLGLLPYSVKFNQNKQKYTILSKSIYVNSIYGVSVVLAIFVFLILHIREVFLTSDSSSITDILLTKINYVAELIILIIFILITYVNAFLNRHKYVKLLNTIISAWNDLSHYKNVMDIKSIYCKVHFLIKCLFLLLLMQCSLNFLQGDRLWRMILMFISFNLAQTLQFVVVLFYYVTIMLLVVLFGSLERQVTQLQKTNEDKCFVQMKTQTLTIKQIKLLYNKAYEAKTEINIVFQYPLLICIFQCFYGLVNEALILYHGVFEQKCITIYKLFHCSFWIVFHLLKIFLLASSGHTLKMKVQKFVLALLDIPIEGNDVRLHMEVQHFSSVIFYKNIVIVLFDCISLDATLMYKTLCTVSLYLIILVQIESNYDLD